MRLDGSKCAQSTLLDIAHKVKVLFEKTGQRPCLNIIQVGNLPASNSYIRAKRKAAHLCNIDINICEFDVNVTQKELIEHIERLNCDSHVHGLIVQLPLPHALNVQEISQKICHKKDVDGFCAQNFGGMGLNHRNIHESCTPKGILMLLNFYHVPLDGQHVVIVGKSHIVGHPMTSLLLAQTGATVTVVHRQTKNLALHTRMADVLIVAAGQPNLITGDMIQPQAVVVDVGINRIVNQLSGDMHLVGDVHVESVSHIAKYLSPVPGGVGPMTVAALMSNVLSAFENYHGVA